MRLRSNGFDKDPERASLAGKKSKRKYSVINAIKLELMNEDKLDQLAKVCIEKAIEGSYPHMKLILDYLEGKPKEKIEIEKTEINIMSPLAREISMLRVSYSANKD